MSLTMKYTEVLAVTHCWCGIAVGIPENLLTWAKESEKHEVYCPLGHVYIFSDGLEQQLAEERRRLRATKDLLLHEERSHAATKGHLTKAKKQVHRVEHGVCPHCNRSFQNLARHMKSKHEGVTS